MSGSPREFLNIDSKFENKMLPHLESVLSHLGKYCIIRYQTYAYTKIDGANLKFEVIKLGDY